MAKEAGKSARSVQRAFRRLYGRTVQEQFEVWRRELLVELLRTNRLYMKEIGDTLGYGNGSTFARACQDWTGCTPKQLEARVLS